MEKDAQYISFNSQNTPFVILSLDMEVEFIFSRNIFLLIFFHKWTDFSRITANILK